MVLSEKRQTRRRRRAGSRRAHNELRVFAARSRRRNSVGRTRWLGVGVAGYGDFTSDVRSAGWSSVAGLGSQRGQRHDVDLGGAFWRLAGVLWITVTTIGCKVENGARWQDELAVGGQLRITVPWPAPA